MSIVTIDDTNLKDIASAIREKNGTTDTYKPNEMASAISNIETGGDEYYNLGYLDGEAGVINGKLTRVVNDRVTTIRQYALYGLYETLEYVYFKNAEKISGNAFNNCRVLKKARFDKVTSITANAFYLCSSLEALVISTPSVCSLSAKLSNNGITLGKGYIYVPDELVEEYKVATNWSTYANQIKPLSELVE